MKIKYVATSHSYYTDNCTFTPHNEFTPTGPNIWITNVGQCQIFITQYDYKSEISEANVGFEPKTGCGIMTQRKEIAKAFNQYISDVYR